MLINNYLFKQTEHIFLTPLMTLPTPTLNLSGCADFAFLPAITKEVKLKFLN